MHNDLMTHMHLIVPDAFAQFKNATYVSSVPVPVAPLSTICSLPSLYDPEFDDDVIPHRLDRQVSVQQAKFLESKLNVITDVLRPDMFHLDEDDVEYDVEEDVFNATLQDVFAVAKKKKKFKPKSETSKIVTRSDGLMYQQVDHFVTRHALYVPKESSPNWMGAKSYTGERITEGIYDKGEKFTDRTKWFPGGATTAWQKDQEARAMKERWKGKTFLQIELEDPAVSDKSLNPREHHPPEEDLEAMLKSPPK